MPVSDQHPEYQLHIPRWQLVRDCVEGSVAVKSRQNLGSDDQHGASFGGTIYLPMPNPEDQSIQNQQRYFDYKQRANFVNFTGQTKEGLVGLVFRQPLIHELPPTIAHLETSTDGGSITLEQLTKGVLCDCLEAGRSGLLTDYPVAPIGLTQDQVNQLNLRANILRYSAESIINWRTAKAGGTKILTMVVLREPTMKLTEDGFSFEEVIFHRVLLLSADNIYFQNLYNENDELIFFGEGDEASANIVPRKSDGSTWDEIPFTFVGTEDNDENVDKASLYDIAEINISHYRNSADYEESSYIVGQPTPFVAGLTQEWVDKVLMGQVTLGSRAAVMLPEGGSAGLIQADPNQMPMKGMEAKEVQMVNIGARIIADKKQPGTAEGERIKFAGQTSKLGSIIGNIEDAMIRSLSWALEFMGGTGDIVFEINRKFYENTVNPQELMASIQMLDRGVIALPDFRDRLRKAGMLPAGRTDDDIDADAGAGNPLL